MTFLAVDTTHPAPPTLSLDALSLAMLRTISSGRAPHPALGGSAGNRARRRLRIQGALSVDGEISPEARLLVAPIEDAQRCFEIHVAGNESRGRMIWTDGSRATSLTPREDGTLTIASCPDAGLGAELTTWLGIRPLPEPLGRAPRPCSAPDVIALSAALHAGDHAAATTVATRPMSPHNRTLLSEIIHGEAVAWTIRAVSLTRRDQTRSITAVDAGRDGWWLSRIRPGQTSDVLAPVGVAAIYVALSQVIR